MVDRREAQDRCGEHFRAAICVGGRASARDSPSLLFTWSRLFHTGIAARPEPKFVPALVMPETCPGDRLRRSSSRVEIVARNGRRLIVDADLDCAVITRLLDAMERR